jgi:hypothetical protein
MKNTIYCLASSEPQANEILTHLRNLGFTSEISVLLKNQGTTRDMTLKEDAIRGAEKGGLLGGALGGIAGLSALAIPGIGPFLALGPILSAIGGAAVGSAVGGLAGGTGAISSLGLPSDIEREVHDRLEHGDILIAVHSNDPQLRDRASRVFRSAGSEDIYYSGEHAA